MDSLERREKPNPRDSASILSILFNSWLFPFFLKGWREPVEIGDLYDPLKQDRSSVLGEQLSLWEEELGKCAADAHLKPSLVRSLMKAFKIELLLLALAILVQVTCSISQSLLLGKLLAHFRPNSIVTHEEAIYYATGMVLSAFAEVMVRSKYEVFAFHTGLRVRAACCALIYRKSLKLSVTALGEMASGQAVNLLSNDVSRFDLVMISLHFLWISPLVVVVITFLLYRDSGAPALCGLAAMIFIVLCQAYIGKLSSIFRRQIAFRTDERIRLVNEVISGINIIKLYAWEDPFIRLVGDARRRELQELRKTSMVRGIYMTFHLCANRIALFCVVVVLFMLDQPISADKVFVLISYYNILTWPLAFFVRGCAEVAECYTSTQRIQNFLMNKEYNDKSSTPSTLFTRSMDLTSLRISEETKPYVNGNENSTNNSFQTKQISNEYTVILSNVFARWNENAVKPTLNNINMKASLGCLHAIIGTVGSGKSSVLQTILGELPVSDGYVKVNGRISYASQDPWVFTATVRQNILFGAPFEKSRYEKVVYSCALQKDFEQLPNKDLTLVGERGASLSGGQRARINLARAVYREAEVYLLDDTLSAVDTHVGRHLFDECIQGYLRSKTVILVTHQLQYLKNADSILLMRNGAVSAIGTFREIIESGIDYAKLLQEDQELHSGIPQSDGMLESQHPPERLLSAVVRKSPLPSNTSSARSERSVNTDIPIGQPEGLEASSEGTINGSLYMHYFKSSGSLVLLAAVGVLFILTQLAVSSTDYWIAFMTKMGDNIKPTDETRGDNAGVPYKKINITSRDPNKIQFNTSSLTVNMGLYIYLIILVCTLLVCTIRTALYYFMVLRISKNIHMAMFKSVIGTAVHFFNTNPSGRILNRFSKDMGSVDEILPKIILDSLQIVLSLLGALSLTIVTNYYLVIPLFCITVIFRFVQRFYLRTAKYVRRLEGIVRSPVFSHLNATLQGMVTIRAFGAEELLVKEFDKHQDLHSAAWYLHLTGSNAFGLTIDMLSQTYNVIMLSTIFLGGHAMSAGEVGLALTQCMVLGGYLQWGIRQSAEVANNMISVERVLEYSNLAPEEQQPSTGTKQIESDWPSKGGIKMDHVYLRYAPNEKPVLRDICFYVNPGEKIGIVGRTGAGKSSLIATLFRTACVDGGVTIDGIETNTVALSRLRSSISIIPQDPVLFSGTMRRNLDPFGEYTDDKLWSALSEVELQQVLTEQQGLDTRVLEGGSNFSVGQRQLVCLARAILRANKILMMDEATANVDPQTDKLIQSTIRAKFKTCTVLTVAHRLDTVIDSDRILVMDNGSVVEFDHPYLLLAKRESVFHKMVQAMGPHAAEQLYEVARRRHESQVYELLLESLEHVESG